MKKVTKAVIPAAGLGTRVLPATKALPKEMLTIVDKPSLQYIVEELVASGITDILIITGRNKNSIEDHFDFSYELENTLKNDFIYNSNAIEGNSLTRQETEVILEYGVTVKGKPLKDHLEVKGQEYAINFLNNIIKPVITSIINKKSVKNKKYWELV